MSYKSRFKRLIFFVLIAFLSLVCIYSKDKAGHYSDIESIFLTDQQYLPQVRDVSRDLTALEGSAHFLLDYMDSPNMRISCREILRGLDPVYFMAGKTFLKMAPYLDVDSVSRDLSANAKSDSDSNYIDCLLNCLVTPGGNTHEKYTHMGWRYYDDKSDSKGHSIIETTGKQWYGRQYIYQKVVNKVFDFGFIDESLSLDRVWRRLKNYGGLHVTRMNAFDRYAYTVETKSSSMAAIVYYVHILSDIEANSNWTSGTRMSLNKLVADLEKQLISLFGAKKYQSDSFDEIRKIIGNNKNFSGTNETAQGEAKKILDAFRKEFGFALEDEGFYKNTQLKKDLDKIQGKYQ